MSVEFCCSVCWKYSLSFFLFVSVLSTSGGGGGLLINVVLSAIKYLRIFCFSSLSSFVWSMVSISLFIFFIYSILSSPGYFCFIIWMNFLCISSIFSWL